MRTLELASKLVGFNTISVKNPLEQSPEAKEIISYLTAHPEFVDEHMVKLINKLDRQNGFDRMKDFIVNYCKEAGFKVYLYPYNVGAGTNIVAIKGDPSQRPGLAFAGHMDTMGFNDKWLRDPLTLVNVNNKYFGLGIADMKLFLAMAMNAGKQISVDELTKPFALYFTYEEEVGCIGAKSLVKEIKTPFAENIVVGEPTEFYPKRMHKGYIYFKVILMGPKGVHSSLGKTFNVIEIALSMVIERLMLFKSRLEKAGGANFNPPYATMNIGKFVQPFNAAKNIVAYNVEIHGDIRPVIGQDNDQIFAMLEALIAQTNEAVQAISSGKIRVSVKLEKYYTPSMLTEKDSEIYYIASEVGNEFVQNITETKKVAEIINPAVAYNTEGGLYRQAGAQTVVWGPASIKVAHKENEYVDEKWFDEAYIDAYLRVIRHFCGKEKIR